MVSYTITKHFLSKQNSPLYEQFEDSVNNQFIKLVWFSWLATEIIKYLLSKHNSNVEGCFKHSV